MPIELWLFWRYLVQPDISLISSLIAEKTRAKMLIALMGGKALTATELALEAEISPQTASTHLSKLVQGQLLVVRKQGRHKYFQLQGPDVASLLESLLSLSSSLQPVKVATGPEDLRLRKSRICYDHLAGTLGVQLYDALAQQDYIVDKQCDTVLTEQGMEFFQTLGLDFIDHQRSKRPMCKSCLDWSERRNHLAGILGQWILTDVFKRGWAKKDLDSRAINFTSNGLKAFCKTYGINLVTN